MNNFKLFHFGKYDIKALKQMKGKIDKDFNMLIDSLIDSSIDVLSIIRSHVYFPTYSHSLKDIGKVLGYQWTDDNASGVQSIIWRETWEENLDPVIKTKLIQYNKEDCLALKTIFDFITSFKSFNQKDISKESQSLKVADTNDLKRNFRERYVCGPLTITNQTR